MTSSASQQIGHLLFELDQLHAKGLLSGFDNHGLARELKRIERELGALCSQQDRSRLLKMSRAYRALTTRQPLAALSPQHR